MKHFLCGLVIATLLAPAFGRDFYPKNQALDIERYKFHIELSDQSELIKARAIVTLRTVTPIQEFSLDLGSQIDGIHGMKVLQVKLGEQSLQFDHINDRLSIRLPQMSASNDLISLEIAYQGIPKSGLHISKNKYGDRVFFADHWPDQGHQWLPTIDHPSDKAAVEFLITAPAQYAVVANGLKVEESSLDGDRKLTHWREDVPIAVKVMVIGVARFAMQESAKLNDVAITSWVFPQNRAEGFHDYSVAVKALDYFQKNVGPYPYKKLANVQSKTRFGGLENANTIFYFENSVTGKGEQEALVAHEIAHQWFGNSTTENDWHHVWLSEGFATYFTNLYIEHTYGRERFVKQMLADREKIIRFHQRVNRPIVDTDIRDPKQVLSPNTYEKAGWVLHMLRQELGDEIFWQGIRHYYTKFAGKNVLSADFQTSMEQVSGKDLSAFFQQWLYQAGYPKLAVQWHFEPISKVVTLKVEQVQDSAQFAFPLDLAIQGGDGKMQLQTVRVNQKNQTFTVPVNSVPKLVSVDPMVRLLLEAKVEQK
nr:M1 family aminopeptidase [uncultured Undibacterium sp.]